MIVWGMLIYSVVGVHLADHELRPHAGRRHRHHRVDRHDGRQLRRVLRADEGRGRCTAARSATRRPAASQSTWRTILAADLVSFIAAAVLFVLSVGSVRGFALYLGVTTICDVIVLCFFTRPAVILLAGTGRLDERRPVRPRADDGDRQSTPPIERAVTRDRPSNRRAARAAASPRRRWRRLDPRPDGDRLLGPAARLAGHLRRRCSSSASSRCRRAGSISASTSRAASPGTCRPASFTVDDARAILDDNGIERRRRPRSRSAPPTAATSSRSRSPTSPRTCASQVQEAFAEAAGVDPADVSVASVSSTWGEEITQQGDHRPRRVPRADRRVHLVPLRVADGARRDPGDAPRRRHQRRHLLGVRLRGHAGDGRSRSSRSSATRCTTRSSCSTGSGRTSGASPPPG